MHPAHAASALVAPSGMHGTTVQNACCMRHQHPDPGGSLTASSAAPEPVMCGQVGTPLCVPSQGGVDLGRIASLELNHKGVDTAKVRALGCVLSCCMRFGPACRLQAACCSMRWGAGSWGFHP